MENFEQSISKNNTCSGPTKHIAAGFPSKGSLAKASTIKIGMSMLS